MTTPLAIATEDDLLTTIGSDDLLEALFIAAEQLDVKRDDEADGYGYPTVEAAHAVRDRFKTAYDALSVALA